jgi:hypothetical protein
LVTVRFRLPEDAASQNAVRTDLEIQFAGQTTTYKQVPFNVSVQGAQAKVAGTIPATMSDFKIEPPSLLSIPTKNEVPVRVDMTWKRL